MFRTSRIMRYINQNKRMILLVIGIIACIIIVIQLLNALAKKQMEESANKSKNNTTINSSNIYNPNETVLTGTEITGQQAEENTQIIEKFIEYCNNGEVQQAYDLLTDECKQNVYSTIDKFNNNYYKKIFTSKRTYSIQSWMTGGNSYTYRVRFLENMLSTGSYNPQTYEDYITVVNANNQTKLNINSYITRKAINKEQSSSDVKINIEYKDIYKEYEEYVIKLTNNTDKEIMLDSLETVDGIKLIGESNNVEYQALTNELSEYVLKTPSKSTRTIKIKFSKEYNSKREASKIQFLNIILDQDAYKENKNETTNKTQIEVKLK